MRRLAYSALWCLVWCCSSAVADRPNILWITSEDNGPHLECYGDTLADTPNLDTLAEKGTIYLNAWSTVPVCAPARTAIITGMYPSSIGAEHMRSSAVLPPEIILFPEYLRAAGYYCTNNQKEDYNVPTNEVVWDESSGRAHWSNRADGQPFFAVFNITVTHESQIRLPQHEYIHDPDSMVLPAHYPDTPESRRDWAQYYDKMTVMDRIVGERIAELEAAGLAEDTIIMYYGDHGVGLPRSKRSPYNSGLRVPLIVVVPEKYRDLAPSDLDVGGATDRLVNFVDLAPTLLTVAGLDVPSTMQGKPFLGAKTIPEKDYLFGLRGRMDERYDMVRVLRDKRYVYIRNYMPHRPHGQHVAYMFQTPSTQAWYAKFLNGTLSPEKAYFWQPRAAEEVYDLQVDPDEVTNLAASPEHADVLARMRAALRETILETRDVGFVPEPDCHTVYQNEVLYTLGHDPEQYPLELIYEVADRATQDAYDSTISDYLAHTHPTVRYWAATGMLIHRDEIGDNEQSALRNMIEESSPSVRIVAAETLANTGSDADLDQALDTLLYFSDATQHHITVATFALNALDNLDARAASVASEIAGLPTTSRTIPNRNRNYIKDLIDQISTDL